MKRNSSHISRQASNKVLGPAYQRIVSDVNIKNLTLPGFLRNDNPFLLKLHELSNNLSPLSPIKPKVLEKYSKTAEESSP